VLSGDQSLFSEPMEGSVVQAVVAKPDLSVGIVYAMWDLATERYVSVLVRSVTADGHSAEILLLEGKEEREGVLNVATGELRSVFAMDGTQTVSGPRPTLYSSAG
jgi:hypothetical protein